MFWIEQFKSTIFDIFKLGLIELKMDFSQCWIVGRLEAICSLLHELTVFLSMLFLRVSRSGGDFNLMHMIHFL